MSLRWQAALLDPSLAGGWAVVHCRQQFLVDDSGVLFPRDWLKRLELPLLSEQGLGHFDGEPVFLFELDVPADVPGARWQGLRQFMQQVDSGPVSPARLRHADRHLGQPAPLLR